MMKAGYFPCQQDPPSGARIGELWNEVVDEAVLAEEVGFDSCLFSEHHQQADGYFPNPLLCAGLVGAKTTKLRVGTCVMLLPLYHPAHAAEDAAMIDVATGGRLIVGVGIGYQPVDFEAFEVSISDRAKRTEEGVEILKRAWTEERFSFQGEHFRLNDVSITPKPLQQPRPPIWMAAWTKLGLRRAARIADGWFADPVQSLPVIKGFADLYREEAAKHGKKPFVALMRDVWIADTAEQAKAESDPIMYTHRFYFRNGAYVPDRYTEGVASEEGWTFDKASRDRFVIGSPEECRDQLARWQEEVRPDYWVFRLRHPGGPSHDRVKQALRLFGEKILPAF